MAASYGGSKPKLNGSETPVMYTARLYTEDRSLDLTTNLPSRFPIGLSTGWDTPFNQPLLDTAAAAVGGRAGQAMQTGERISRVVGQTTLHKWMSGSVWNNGSSLVISEIPFILMAYSDPKKEVLRPFKTLLKMVAPNESTKGLLMSPGPHLTAQNSLQLGGDIITLEIGNFFKMKPCIIESVNGDADTQFDEQGTPISMTVSVTVKSFWCVSQQDIEKFFVSL